MLVSKTRVITREKREKNKNTSESMHSVIRPLQYILLNVSNMENFVDVSKNTISLVVIVILTVSFN